MQHLPDYPSDGQQRVLSHAAAEPVSSSCVAAQNGQQKRHVVQEQQQSEQLQHEPGQQPEPMQAEEQQQLPPLVKSVCFQPLTLGSSGSMPEQDVQELLRFSSGGSMSGGASFGVHTRQPSMLSDSGRASRRTSLMHGDSFSDSPVPPIVHQVGDLAALVDITVGARWLLASQCGFCTFGLLTLRGIMCYAGPGGTDKAGNNVVPLCLIAAAALQHGAM